MMKIFCDMCGADVTDFENQSSVRFSKLRGEKFAKEYHLCLHCAELLTDKIKNHLKQ